MTLLAITIVSVFLMPLATWSRRPSRSRTQLTAPDAPLYPAAPETFLYEGEEFPVYDVPMPDGSLAALGADRAGPRVSTFIDPADPDAGQIEWEGRWRTLEQHWAFSLNTDNFMNAWNTIEFPRLFFNTFAIAGAVDDRRRRVRDLRRLRVQPLPLPGPRRHVHPDDRDDHPAVPGDADPDVCRLPASRMGRDVAAADHPALLRERLQRLPAAAVLPRRSRASSTRPR